MAVRGEAASSRISVPASDARELGINCIISYEGMR